MDLTFYLFVVVCVETVVIIQMIREIKSLKPRYKYRGFNIEKKIKRCKNQLAYMDTLDGQQFEDLCCELLEQVGFKNIKKTVATGDYGIDIVCKKNNVTYGIQCKCYSSNIGVDAVQQAYTGCAFYKCDVAVVLTNRYFTDNAQQLARVVGVKLWSRNFIANIVNELVD